MTEEQQPHVSAKKPFNPRHYDLMMAGMVTVLLCANLIGPAKVAELDLPLIGLVAFGAGNLFFPISYIFADCLTEVYGYSRARRAIWAGFIALIFATAMGQLIVHMPPSPDEPFNAVLQPALETVFGGTWRIVLASIIAYWVGDFANAYVMAKMKIWTQGKHLWTRTIGSTLVGQGLDSMIFYPIAFAGIWTSETLLMVIIANFSLKVGVEVFFTPVTYFVVNRLKRAEGRDVYDEDTDFTPFVIKGES
ncbi:MAG: queuosine precursor transporter [Alphaproteobacteria bacterium]